MKTMAFLGIETQPKWATSQFPADAKLAPAVSSDPVFPAGRDHPFMGNGEF